MENSDWVKYLLIVCVVVAVIVVVWFLVAGCSSGNSGSGQNSGKDLCNCGSQGGGGTNGNGGGSLTAKPNAIASVLNAAKTTVTKLIDSQKNVDRAPTVSPQPDRDEKKE